MVAPQAPPAVGGVERHVAELARELVRRGLAVTLAVCDPSGALPRASEIDGVAIRRFRTIGDNGFYVSPWLARWAWQNAGRFDLVHGHAYHAPVALAAFAAARRRARPFVLTTHYHGTGHSPLRRALHVPYRPIARGMVRAADGLIAVSHAEAELLRRDFGRDLEISVVPNGVDIEAIRAAVPFAAGDGRRVIVVAGRLEPYKRVDRVVDAMPLLRETHRLVVVGEGPERGPLEARAVALDLGSTVSFVGALDRPDVLRWLRTADVVVTLSEREAYGLVAVEAAAAGAAVIASAIPAHLELRAAIPGRIDCMPLDADRDALAAAVRRAGRSDHGDTVGIASWSEVAERTIGAYERAATASRRPATEAA
jgi:glycosyltransferase involved in cell wall biosynthesis